MTKTPGENNFYFQNVKNGSLKYLKITFCGSKNCQRQNEEIARDIQFHSNLKC